MSDNRDPVDQLARETYAAHLIVDGFSEESADRMAANRCPDEFYAAAEGMIQEAGR